MGVVTFRYALAEQRARLAGIEAGDYFDARCSSCYCDASPAMLRKCASDRVAMLTTLVEAERLAAQYDDNDATPASGPVPDLDGAADARHDAAAAAATRGDVEGVAPPPVCRECGAALGTAHADGCYIPKVFSTPLVDSDDVDDDAAPQCPHCAELKATGGWCSPREAKARAKIVDRIIRAKREAGFPLKSVFFTDVWPVALDALRNQRARDAVPPAGALGNAETIELPPGMHVDIVADAARFKAGDVVLLAPRGPISPAVYQRVDELLFAKYAATGVRFVLLPGELDVVPKATTVVDELATVAREPLTDAQLARIRDAWAHAHQGGDWFKVDPTKKPKGIERIWAGGKLWYDRIVGRG